jgi:hypothetical protein
MISLPPLALREGDGERVILKKGLIAGVHENLTFIIAYFKYMAIFADHFFNIMSNLLIIRLFYYYD